MDHSTSCVNVNYTPTIPHCSMATLIGLSIKVCLLRSLPPKFKVEVKISPGSHASEAAVNKQIADKERVSAALENNNLIEVVNQCLVKALKWLTNIVFCWNLYIFSTSKNMFYFKSIINNSLHLTSSIIKLSSPLSCRKKFLRHQNLSYKIDIYSPEFIVLLKIWSIFQIVKLTSS